jgi:hypothetical protein
MALTQEERAAINRENAQKSTGPRTVEGKASSSQNALKHGFTARAGVLVPGEDPIEHQAFVQEWFDGYAPATPGRRALVERAADVAWKLRRLSRAGDARAAQAAREAETNYNLAQFRRAEALGEHLRYDNPRATQTCSKRGERQHPAAVNRELETFLEGVKWKIARWVELRDVLDNDGHWKRDGRYFAVRLLGARPEDVLVCLTARRVLRLGNAMLASKSEFIDDVAHATSAHPERSSQKITGMDMLSDPRSTPDEARAIARELCRIEVKRLRELLPDLEEQAELARAEAPLRALADVAATTTPQLQRYEHALDRTLRQTIATLDATWSEATWSEPSLFPSDEALPTLETPPDAFEPEVEVEVKPEPEPAPEPEPVASPEVKTAATSVVSPRQNEANPPVAAAPSAPVSQPESPWHPPLIWAA